MEVIDNFDNSFTGIIWDKSSEGELAISNVAHVFLLWIKEMQEGYKSR